VRRKAPAGASARRRREGHPDALVFRDGGRRAAIGAKGQREMTGTLQSASRSARQRGSALVLTLAVLVLLSIIGTAFVILMRTETAATRNFSEDAEARFLALQALSYVLNHPGWTLPAGTDVDNDNDGTVESMWFTKPLSDLATDTHARFSFLKKNAGCRLNVNWDSFYHQSGAFAEQAQNVGAAIGEISMERAIASYIDALIPTYFPAANPADSPTLAREIALRFCNYRYGQFIGTPPTPPLPAGLPVANYPGSDAVDDDQWLEDTTLAVGAAPTQIDPDDAAKWVTPLPTPVGQKPYNWRPLPQADRVDNDGDGLIDETAAADPNGIPEELDSYDEFVQYPMILGGLWPPLDDQPFGSQDLQIIVQNAPPTGSDPPIKAIINDVFLNWAGANGIAGYGAGVVANDDYFEPMRHIFTTYNSEYIGAMAPVNHLNYLIPEGASAAERSRVESDRNRFVAAMREVLLDGGVSPAAADNTAWQILANLVDFLDEDLDAAGSDVWNGNASLHRDLLTRLTKVEGWTANEALYDLDLDGTMEPGEPGWRVFFGTERQPLFNEFWIYNRGYDQADNDGDGYRDQADRPTNPPTATAPYEYSSDAGFAAFQPQNGYYIELYNQYATGITLYNDPVNATDPTVDWYIRVLDSAGVQKATYRLSLADKRSGGGWTTDAAAYVPPGGYFVIATRDYVGENGNDGVSTVPDLTTWPDGTAVILNTAGGPILEDTLVFEPGDVVELVYSYDHDGTGPSYEAEDAVVDRQKMPHTTVLTDKSMGDVMSPADMPPKHNFAPSWERQDPRLAACYDYDPTTLPLNLADPVARGFTAPLPLIPTEEYRAAEAATAGTGGDAVRHTLGTINDDGAGGDPFDGNYTFGETSYPGYLPLMQPGGLLKTRFDDLVDIVNDPTFKFANPGMLGALLCVGPLPPAYDLYGWSSTEWLAANSPYTFWTSDPTTSAGNGTANPLDAKKVDFLSGKGTGDDPRGAARAIFDVFTTVCPWEDGKDNDGDWNPAATPTDDRDGDGGPSPGDFNVDEDDEVYVYGRVTVNAITPESQHVMSALPYVRYNDSKLYRPGFTDIERVYLTSVDDTVTAMSGTPENGIVDLRGSDQFRTRKEFLEKVVLQALDLANDDYDPAADIGAFGRDTEDNNIVEFTGTARRTARAYEWDTIALDGRTSSSTGSAARFILPGEAGDGGDLLVDDKSEMDATVGAIMNSITLSSDLPQDFSAITGPGIVTYYVTVQITDGEDVDGQDDTVPADSIGDGEPDWKEGTILAEKRIIAVVDTSVSSTDPRKVTLFNWSVEGNYVSK
jgi:hypothetical protein